MRITTVALVGSSLAFLAWAIVKRREILDGDIATLAQNNASQRKPPLMFDHVQINLGVLANADGTERIASDAEWEIGKKQLWDAMQQTQRF